MLPSLARVPRQLLNSKSVERSQSFMAHKLPGNKDCISSSEILPPVLQHIGSLIHKSRGGSAVVISMHQILLRTQGKMLSVRAVYIPEYLNEEADIRTGDWRLHAETVD